MNNFIYIISDILEYIFQIRIADIPLHLAYLGINIFVSYCIAMIIVGIPVSIYESITKKEIPHKHQEKIVKITSVCLIVIIGLRLLYELASKN